MAFTEDLTAFFNTDDFADAATLAGVDVVGIFDNGYVESATGAASRQPTFTLPTASVPALSTDAIFIHAGQRYTVEQHEPDGTGVSVLFLALAPLEP